MNYDESALQLLSALAEPTRWKMLKLLRQKPATSISHIAKKVGISSTATANHIKVLEEVNLVSRKKRGKYHGIEINHELWKKIQLFLIDTV
jgi:predicted transcriptional regulator